MKGLLALLLSAAVFPASAFAVDLAEGGKPLSATPGEATAMVVLPAAALPGDGLKIPSAEISIAPPVAAEAALTQTAARLDGKQDAQTLTASFDGSKKLGAALAAGALTLAASPAAPILALTPAAPAAYEAWRIARAPKKLRWRSPDAAKTTLGRLGEVLQFVPPLLASSFLLLLARLPLGVGLAFGVAAGLSAVFAALAAADLLAQDRGKLVQLWQASHDQKYRTDYATGQIRDIRGHRYGQGSDRYDENVPGRLSAAETAGIRLLAVGAALALAHALGAAPAALLAANLAAAAGFALRDYRHKPSNAPLHPSTPDR